VAAPGPVPGLRDHDRAGPRAVRHDQELTDDLALLVAFYTVAAYQPGRRILLAAVIMAAGAVLVATRARHPLPVWALLSGLVAGAAFLGYYARTRRAYLAAWSTGPNAWNGSATSRLSSPRLPSGSGSPARCTTSSRTISL
jgi:hypothetical protein